MAPPATPGIQGWGPGTAGGPSTIWWTRWWESSSASAISRSEPPEAWSFLIAAW